MHCVACTGQMIFLRETVERERERPSRDVCEHIWIFYVRDLARLNATSTRPQNRYTFVCVVGKKTANAVQAYTYRQIIIHAINNKHWNRLDLVVACRLLIFSLCCVCVCVSVCVRCIFVNVSLFTFNFCFHDDSQNDERSDIDSLEMNGHEIR